MKKTRLIALLCALALLAGLSPAALAAPEGELHLLHEDIALEGARANTLPALVVGCEGQALYAVSDLPDLELRVAGPYRYETEDGDSYQIHALAGLVEAPAAGSIYVVVSDTAVTTVTQAQAICQTGLGRTVSVTLTPWEAATAADARSFLLEAIDIYGDTTLEFQVSADGADVNPEAYWSTQGERDAFEAALAAAINVAYTSQDLPAIQQAALDFQRAAMDYAASLRQGSDPAAPIPLQALTLSDREFAGLGLVPGDTGTFRDLVSLHPWNPTDSALTWTSSDPAVLRVDAATGDYEALAEGEVTVTVAALSDPAISASVDLTVATLPERLVEQLVANVLAAAFVQPSDDGADVSSDALWVSREDYAAILAALRRGYDLLSQPSALASDLRAARDQLDAIIFFTQRGTGPAGLPVSPAAVLISSRFAALAVGEERALTASIFPAAVTQRDVTWTSSDPAVLAVDAQAETCRAVAPGTVTVTAASAADPSVTDSFTVTVTAPSSGASASSRRAGRRDQEAAETPETPAASAFEDVPATAWYAPAVAAVAARGLLTAPGATRFSPAAPAARAEVWAALAQLAGADLAGGDEAAQAWAVAQGVSDGADPLAPVTREQLAVMLYRAAGAPAPASVIPASVSPSGEAALAPFADAAAVSPWALPAVTWAVQTGLLRGRDGALLAPGGSASRAEAAALLARFLDLE